MRRVLVVGDPSGANEVLPDNLTHGELEHIFELQTKLSRAREPGAYDEVVRADDPEGLLVAVSAVARRSVIDVLDIADHGRPGLMRIGKHALFETDTNRTDLTGAEVLGSLAALVAEGGCIRLLGCRTAAFEDGRALLRRMARATGNRSRVYGTIGRVQLVHFHAPGFLGANNLLFSSEAAIDYPAPTDEDREHNLNLV